MSRDEPESEPLGAGSIQLFAALDATNIQGSVTTQVDEFGLLASS